MSRVAIAGVFSVICSVLVLGYQGINMFMEKTKGFEYVLIIDLLEDSTLDWIDGLSSYVLQRGIDFFIELPLFAVLLVFGLIMLGISSFLWK